jgi:hypothetical protein
MEQGIIRTNPNTILKSMGYNVTGNHITVEKIDVDLFSNQVIIRVKGECSLYPVSIEPIPEFKAVTGL